MEILKEIRPVRDLVGGWKRGDKSVALVPTMGFLHDGHASLIKKARADNDKVVVSVFLNPAQFAPGEDLATYPRDWDRDAALCESLGADAVFSPEPAVMYPPSFAAEVSVPSLSRVLCGASRPVHFNGVCLVVVKLLNIVSPRRAYFGLKDAQQFFILRRLARDLDLDVELVPCPIVREPDGLALSSRNSYLSPAERTAALALSQGLFAARRLVADGETGAGEILEAVVKTIAAEPLARLDYAQAVETATLRPVARLEGECLVAAAMWMGRTRLIDNFIHPLE
ncbi:MAG: pantoate--beta-alanine ligase [Deltaproteobacteria bacterium]|jgi:pantoate--beta-alanine ligase|nr:pantoate--beta-alanine ligase [Deltaproteobacteria bacterium]